MSDAGEKEPLQPKKEDEQQEEEEQTEEKTEQKVEAEKEQDLLSAEDKEGNKLSVEQRLDNLTKHLLDVRQKEKEASDKLPDDSYNIVNGLWNGNKDLDVPVSQTELVILSVFCILVQLIAIVAMDPSMFGLTDSLALLDYWSLIPLYHLPDKIYTAAHLICNSLFSVNICKSLALILFATQILKEMGDRFTSVKHAPQGAPSYLSLFGMVVMTPCLALCGFGALMMAQTPKDVFKNALAVGFIAGMDNIIILFWQNIRTINVPSSALTQKHSSKAESDNHTRNTRFAATFFSCYVFALFVAPFAIAALEGPESKTRDVAAWVVLLYVFIVGFSLSTTFIISALMREVERDQQKKNGKKLDACSAFCVGLIFFIMLGILLTGPIIFFVWRYRVHHPAMGIVVPTPEPVSEAAVQLAMLSGSIHELDFQVPAMPHLSPEGAAILQDVSPEHASLRRRI